MNHFQPNLLQRIKQSCNFILEKRVLKGMYFKDSFCLEFKKDEVFSYKISINISPFGGSLLFSSFERHHNIGKVELFHYRLGFYSVITCQNYLFEQVFSNVSKLTENLKSDPTNFCTDLRNVPSNDKHLLCCCTSTKTLPAICQKSYMATQCPLFL